MPNHQIPLFLSNDPEQVDEVSEDGSRFTIRLTPPIFVPARRLDGSNVVPTISARSIDIINSMHNVSLQHKNHEFLIGTFNPANPNIILSTYLITIENGIYSLEELYAAMNIQIAQSNLSTYQLTLAPLSIKNRVQVTLNDVHHTLIVSPTTHGLQPLVIAGLANSTCKHTMTITCSCHSFNFVDETKFTNVITVSNEAISRSNLAQSSPTELIESLTIPNTTTVAVTATSWDSKHVGVGMKNGTKVKTFNATSLSKARFRTTWATLETRLNNALVGVNTSLHSTIIRGTLLSTTKQSINALFSKLQSHVNVYQDEFGDFLGIEIYLTFHQGETDNMVSGNTHYTMCSLDGEALGASELLCAMNDTFDSDTNSTYLQLGALNNKFKVPYLYDRVTPSSPFVYDGSSDDNTHSHPRAFVHVKSATRITDTSDIKSDSFASTALNTDSALMNHYGLEFHYPYPITLGNQFGKLLGLYELKNRHFVYQNIGGGFDDGTITTFVAKGAAQFDHASTLHLSCSLANGSISSDGHGARGIICSWPMSQVAQGAHASIMYSTPIKVPCRMAGMHTDRVTFQVTDVVGERPHLSGERLLLNVVIEYDT